MNGIRCLVLLPDFANQLAMIPGPKQGSQSEAILRYEAGQSYTVGPIMMSQPFLPRIAVAELLPSCCC